MLALSYNGINGQALYMYVIMWTRRHVQHVGMSGITADIIASWASAHRRADIPSGRQAVQCTNFYTLQEIKYYHYCNTCKYA